MISSLLRICGLSGLREIRLTRWRIHSQLNMREEGIIKWYCLQRGRSKTHRECRINYQRVLGSNIQKKYWKQRRSSKGVKKRARRRKRIKRAGASHLKMKKCSRKTQQPSSLFLKNTDSLRKKKAAILMQSHLQFYQPKRKMSQGLLNWEMMRCLKIQTIRISQF